MQFKTHPATGPTPWRKRSYKQLLAPLRAGKIIEITALPGEWPGTLRCSLAGSLRRWLAPGERLETSVEGRTILAVLHQEK